MPRDFNDPQMQQYFSTLPIHVQETIKQSAVQIETEAELRNIAEQMMQNRGKQ